MTRFLIGTGIIPLSLKIMERGSNLSKAVATFILQKILLDDYGLECICGPNSSSRFGAVNKVLTSVVNSLASVDLENDVDSLQLLKRAIRCYLRLCDHAK